MQIKYFQFCFENGDVGILKTPSSIPSEEHIKNKEWEFCPCPCPLKEPPPIPTNIFLHHLNSTRSHPRSTWLNRLPKKLNHSIHECPNSVHVGWQAHGWGIHIIEGPNGKAILALTVITSALSLVAALVWASLKNDVSGAFGIAAFVVATVKMLVFAENCLNRPVTFAKLSQ